MIDIKLSKNGVVSINSITMGTNKYTVKKYLNDIDEKYEEFGGAIKISLHDSNFSKTTPCTIWLNENDSGDVCDGLILYEKLSYEDAKLLQALYVDKTDRAEWTKTERETKEKGEIRYSYKSNIFALDIVRFREGGESADLPSQDKDYAVSILLTSMIENIKNLSDIKRLLYRGDIALKKENKYKKAFWPILLCNSLAILLLSIYTLWPTNNNVKLSDPPKSGRYLYVDDANVLHIKNGCKAVYKERGMQPVEPILKEELKRKNLERVCSQCVSEKLLDSLRWYTEYSNDGNDIDKDIWEAE